VLFYCFAGEDQAVKNLPLAQNAVHILTIDDPGVELFVMSNAERNDVRLIMNASDCLLITSLHEGSPNIVKEAMACNLPVVSVPCGDVNERLKEVSPGGVYGYDAWTLADGIRQVLAVGKRSNGRDEIIRQGLTASTVAKSLNQIYQRAIEECAFGRRYPFSEFREFRRQK
jgi:glycosyltransferase involved in cell wall biosynthesis